MPATSRTPKADGATPAMAQWFAAKEAHPDALVFFRMGDFYELFFSDAEAAAAALDIALTQRGEHNGAPVPMCGVPQHAAEAYLARLIRRGFRVAVAEQMEDPKARTGKAPIRRAVVRLVTPGTITEEALLEAGQANLLLALAQDGRAGVGAAWLDVSTGLFETMALAQADLPGLLGRLEPAEILAPATLPLGDWAARRAPDVVPSPPLVARRRLAEAFGVASVDAFGSFADAEAIAAVMAVDYVRATQAGTLPRLARPDSARRRRAPVDGRGDARQPGNPPCPRRRHAALAAGHGAANAQPCRGAHAGGLAVGAAHRHRGDCGAAGCVVLAAGRTCGGRAAARVLCGQRPISPGRSRGCR